MAKQMVVTYGMSDIGPWSLVDQQAMSGDVIMRMMARNSMSEELQSSIDLQMKKIAAEAYEVALEHVRNNRDAMDELVEVLVQKETLTGNEMRSILSKYAEIPEGNMPAPAVSI